MLKELDVFLLALSALTSVWHMLSMAVEATVRGYSRRAPTIYSPRYRILNFHRTSNRLHRKDDFKRFSMQRWAQQGLCCITPSLALYTPATSSAYTATYTYSALTPIYTCQRSLTALILRLSYALRGLPSFHSMQGDAGLGTATNCPGVCLKLPPCTKTLQRP